MALPKTLRVLCLAGIAAALSSPSEAGELITSFANNRPTLATADGAFSLSMRATAQFDTGFYFQDGATTASLTPALGRELSNGTNFRRGQFGIDGKLFKDFSYALILDFGGSSSDFKGRVAQAWVQYNGLKPFQFRIGAFAPFIGLEDSTSAADLVLIERPSASELSRSLTGADSRAAVQIAAIGQDYLAAFSYTGAKVTGDVPYDSQQAVNARLAYLLYSNQDTKWVGSLTGVYEFDAPDPAAGTTGPTNISLSDRPEMRVDSLKLIGATIDAESLLIGGVETGFVWKNFYSQGGWFTYHLTRRASALPDPDFSGWYLQASWVLTGETRSYNPGRASFLNPKPAAPFGQGIGAWELAMRYSVMNLNDNADLTPAAGGVRGGEQKILTTGVNWYPNSTVKFLFDYYYVDIDRLSANAIAASPPYPAVAAGADIGQSYSAFNIRAQIAF